METIKKDEKDTRPQWAIDAGISAERLKNITPFADYGPEEHGAYFRTSMKNGEKRIYISPMDMGFVNQVRKLPAITRVQMMNLSDKELENYIAEQKKYSLNWVIDILGKQWYWRESGDPAIIEPGMLPGTDLNADMFLKKCKSKRPPPKTIIEGVIEWYVGDRSEVYLKD